MAMTASQIGSALTTLSQLTVRRVLREAGLPGYGATPTPAIAGTPATAPVKATAAPTTPPAPAKPQLTAEQRQRADENDRARRERCREALRPRVVALQLGDDDDAAHVLARSLELSLDRDPTLDAASVASWAEARAREVREGLDAIREAGGGGDPVLSAKDAALLRG